MLAALVALPVAAGANCKVDYTSLAEARIDTSRVVDLDELVVVSQPKESSQAAAVEQYCLLRL